MNSETSILKKRVYAFTTDFSIIILTNYFLMTAFGQFIKTVFFHFPTKFQILLINKMGIMSSLSIMLLTFSYFSIFYFVTNGHTMGKSIFGLRVYCPTGEDITLKQSIQRSLAHFACAMTGSFLFALSFIRKDEKSLADILSNTGVKLEADEIKSTSDGLQLVPTPPTEIAKDKEEIEYFDQNKAA